MCLCSVGITTTFLFTEGNWSSIVRSNYKVDLELVRTSLIRMIKMVEELAVTLNKLNLDAK